LQSSDERRDTLHEVMGGPRPFAHATVSFGVNVSRRVAINGLTISVHAAGQGIDESSTGLPGATLSLWDWSARSWIAVAETNNSPQTGVAALTATIGAEDSPERYQQNDRIWVMVSSKGGAQAGSATPARLSVDSARFRLSWQLPE